MQLCVIPGISVNKANSIAEFHQVKNMNEFLEQLKGTKDPAKFFKDTPGIGKVLAKTIYSYCLNTD
jgi:hypothetical protein